MSWITGKKTLVLSHMFKICSHVSTYNQTSLITVSSQTPQKCIYTTFLIKIW
jgi:hypothetical protein